MKSGKTLLILTSMIGLGTGAWLLKKNPAALVPTATPALQTETAASPATRKSQEGLPSRALASLPSGAQIATATATSKPLDAFEFQRELDDFAFLKRKVFLNEKEKDEKKRLLSNADFIKGLADFLRTRHDRDFESETQRSLALDLLFEALEKEGSAPAAEALKALVQDNFVENTQADMNARKSVAGIKAEILYQWSALDPSKAAEMQSWLPGPVSQKIWRNVRAAQQQNLAESSLEAKTPAHE